MLARIPILGFGDAIRVSWEESSYNLRHSKRREPYKNSFSMRFWIWKGFLTFCISFVSYTKAKYLLIALGNRKIINPGKIPFAKPRKLIFDQGTLRTFVSFHEGREAGSFRVSGKTFQFNIIKFSLRSKKDGELLLHFRVGIKYLGVCKITFFATQKFPLLSNARKLTHKERYIGCDCWLFSL